MPKRELDVSDVEAEAMLRTAEMKSERDYLGLELIGRSRGFRLGEIFGVKQRTRYSRWVDRHDHSKGRLTLVSVTDLPGIRVEDLREGAVWVKRKGGAEKKLKLPTWFYERLTKFARGKTGKLFPFRERQGYNLVQLYARLSGMQDWALMHPHRWRSYYITRAYERYGLVGAQHLAGHKTWRTTLRYIAKPTPEKEAEMVEGLSPAADV